MRQKVTQLLLISILTLFLAPSTKAASSSWSDSVSRGNTPSSRVDEAKLLFEQGKQFTEQKNYKKALRIFKKADELDKDNPEILNMLAYNHRRLGNLKEAFELYEKTLELKPKFPEAREYLGAAHIQAAIEQINILRSYRSFGAEARAELITIFKRAAENLK